MIHDARTHTCLHANSVLLGHAAVYSGQGPTKTLSLLTAAGQPECRKPSLAAVPPHSQQGHTLGSLAAVGSGLFSETAGCNFTNLRRVKNTGSFTRPNAFGITTQSFNTYCPRPLSPEMPSSCPTHDALMSHYRAKWPQGLQGQFLH